MLNQNPLDSVDGLTLQEFAARSSLSTSTLKRLNRQGLGPPRVEIGKRVVYLAQEGSAWMREGKLRHSLAWRVWRLIFPRWGMSTLPLPPDMQSVSVVIDPSWMTVTIPVKFRRDDTGHGWEGQLTLSWRANGPSTLHIEQDGEWRTKESET
jgi:predicted DNA-binding transcriptional regulator AlpA